MRSSPAWRVSSGALLAICVSLVEAGALLVTYVHLTRTASGSNDDLDDDDACVPFVHVFRLFAVIQALNSSFYVGCVVFLNRILAKIAEDVDMGSLGTR